MTQRLTSNIINSLSGFDLYWCKLSVNKIKVFSINFFLSSCGSITWIFVCVCVCVCIYICMHIYIYLHIFIFIYSCIFINIYIISKYFWIYKNYIIFINIYTCVYIYFKYLYLLIFTIMDIILHSTFPCKSYFYHKIE